jgi:hypothetical protein
LSEVSKTAWLFVRLHGVGMLGVLNTQPWTGGLVDGALVEITTAAALAVLSWTLSRVRGSIRKTEFVGGAGG